jgi:ABC-2 type transport system permease protein
MRTLLILLRKEFKQIFRNKTILALIIVMPTMQFLILPLAANYEFKNINLVVVDNDHSSVSRQMISKIIGSGYFKLVDNAPSFKAAYSLIETDAADVVLEIPANFERNLVRENSQKVFLAVNAINGTKANLGGSYLNQILRDFNKDILLEMAPGIKQASGLEIVSSNWFNPKNNYKLVLIPGILAILVTMVGGFMTALNIVREKEVGTIEQINVSPISKAQFVLGKLLPFWILGNVVFTNGLILGYLIYDIVPQGSIPLLYFFVAVYLFAILGFGLLVSTFCQTQQQAMFIMFFFMMVFVLMSGLFTPIESMPEWAQWIAAFNPVTYLIQVVRMVMLKASSLSDMLHQLGVIAAMAVVLNSWAVWNYRKTG